jgi:LysM repeat protein
MNVTRCQAPRNQRVIRVDDTGSARRRTLFRMQSSRSSTRVRRLGALVGPVLVGAFVLSSCGGGESAATQSTIDLSAASTAFVVRPPATTEPPVDTAADPDAIVEGTQEYTVQSGDAPYVLVNRFGVTLEDLLGVNEWTSPDQFPFPGTVILIPPGGKSVAAATTPTPDAADATTNAASEPIPDAGDNCAPGTYTVVEGDYLGKVASKFDVTVEALNAANVNTSGYSSFYVGLEIVIPAKSDC